MDDFSKLLKEHAVLPLWPEAGRILGLQRNSTYAAARSGDIRTIRIGHLLKVTNRLAAPAARPRNGVSGTILSRLSYVYDGAR